MSFRLAAAAVALAMAVFSAASANAACGVLQESATARTVDKAIRTADRRIQRQVWKLYNQSGKKLQLEKKSVACVGGSVAVDAQGNQTIGRPSCTVTQPFCVNP